MMFPRTRAQQLVAVAIAAVAVAVGAGLWRLGPPATVRARRLDAARVDDLRQWTRAIDDYWTAHRELPPTLDDVLRQSTWSPIRLTDPESGQRYRYTITGAVTYELCADFARPSESADAVTIWRHDAGPTCFSFEARAIR